jgi:hypothetical protein
MSHHLEPYYASYGFQFTAKSAKGSSLLASDETIAGNTTSNLDRRRFADDQKGALSGFGRFGHNQANIRSGVPDGSLGERPKHDQESADLAILLAAADRGTVTATVHPRAGPPMLGHNAQIDLHALLQSHRPVQNLRQTASGSILDIRC